MNETKEPVSEMENIRILLIDGSNFVIPIPKGQFVNLCVRVRNDGMIFSGDLCIPWEKIKVIFRAEAFSEPVQSIMPWAAPPSSFRQ